jgi:triacylglycerol lipase
MLARLQQITTFAMLLAAGLWAAWCLVDDRPWWAVAGAALILFGYALFLGAEFILLTFAHGDDPTPRASPAQLLRAWWGEVLAAPRVFCWRQPFRSHAEPDHLPSTPGSQRGVVLLHGFVCNRGFWNPWMLRLREAGIPFVAIDLEPVFGPIDHCVESVAAAVQRIRQATGQAPVIVAHSMGGLVARAWLRSPENRPLVHRVFTIGTPHRGTWLARFAMTLNGLQMQQGSDWLVALAQDELRASPTSPYTGFTCFYSHCDNIVFPPSTATLPGADNRHVSGSAHVHLAYQEAVFNEVWRCVAAASAAPADALVAQ